MSKPSLAERVIARDPRAIARAISLIEDELPAGATLVGQLHPQTGRAFLVGVTGPPGAGKSTLVDRLIAEYRRQGKHVGVLCVDPTSPYTGGAVLGDRVRMQGHAEDPGVFIRSMATRGHLGGLARTTGEAAIVLDAAGYDVVIVETVGVGQDEVDIVRTADVSIVTVVPGAGDEVQALKAGIMEIADVFVVNKADREGADRTAASIESMLSLEQWPADAWRPPVLRTVATTGAGVAELVETIERFREKTGAVLRSRRRARAEWRLREILGRSFMDHVEKHVLASGELDALLDRIATREVDHYGVAQTVLARATGRRASSGLSLDHVGVAVRDPAELVGLFDRLFGLQTGEPEDVGAHRVRFVGTAGTTVELVEARTSDSPIARFLEKRGPGLHHLCFLVPDIDAAMTTLKERGVQFIDEQPRRGAHGSRIAFLKPASVGGLLVELKQK
ncbi:MAG TPA: methylmalonyl Co-A mutase-associated GTPase MeaB [Vicinamibacterales bacterium]|nr:methylmalonyl Co-A mutase-associated GTPase MeaB [Vicinamibacterales bacterium]